MCVVIDLNVVCLICLQPSKDLHSIFTTDGDDPELQIAQKISILSELKIDQNNQTLPRRICTKCFQDLKAAWRFRKNCKAAVTIFRTIVKLENVQQENTTSKELTEQKRKVPNGLQVLLTCINTDSSGEQSKKSGESLIYKKTAPVEEFIINSDKEGSLYEELEPNIYIENQSKDGDDFQALEESTENDPNEENNLVEYYLTEDCVSEEITNEEEIQERVHKRSNEDKQLNSTIYIEVDEKRPMRGRPRKQNMLQKELSKERNVVQTRTKGKIVVDSANSSEEATPSEVRQVKARKRKSISSDRKTPKICEICGNSYRFQHALNAHMRRHYNDKPFPCECCDKAFVSNVELRRHMRVHTGQKPYACQYCERRFSDFGSRIKHERTHTGERPYHCDTCGKSFAYPHVLSVHVRTHTGEKRFRCDYCTKGFTKKTYLLSHVNQHHGSFQIIVDETMDKTSNNLKSQNFGECDYTTELKNEDYDNDTNEMTSKTIASSSLEQKAESDDETHLQ